MALQATRVKNWASILSPNSSKMLKTIVQQLGKIHEKNFSPLWSYEHFKKKIYFVLAIIFKNGSSHDAREKLGRYSFSKHHQNALHNSTTTWKITRKITLIILDL